MWGHAVVVIISMVFASEVVLGDEWRLVQHQLEGVILSFEEQVGVLKEERERKLRKASEEEDMVQMKGVLLDYERELERVKSEVMKQSEDIFRKGEGKVGKAKKKELKRRVLEVSRIVQQAFQEQKMKRVWLESREKMKIKDQQSEEKDQKVIRDTSREFKTEQEKL